MVSASDVDIDLLLDQGLEHFEGGEPAKALEKWYRVLDVDPANDRALEYVQRAREGLSVDVREPRLFVPVHSAMHDGASQAPPPETGWGDLAAGDIDLDPTTGATVERAAETKDERARRMLAAIPVEPAQEGRPLPHSFSLDDVEDPVDILDGPPLPDEQPVLSVEGFAEVPSAAAEPAPPPPDVDNPWDGHSSVTEAVDLDVAAEEATSPMALLLATANKRSSEAGGAVVSAAASQRQRDAPLAAAVDDNEVESLMEGARDLFALGDFTGSLELVEKVLELEPGHAEGREYLEKNEATLLKMLASKLGDLQGRPRVLTSPDEVIWMNLHHRAGFMLSQVDGELSYEDLAAVSGMSRLETFRILVELLHNGVIG